jgi:MFS family permease
MSLPVLYVLFFLLFFTGGPSGQIVAAVAKELFPITISGTSVGTVNLFPFAGGAFFQILVGAVLTANHLGEAQYSVSGFRHMFAIFLGGAVISFVAAIFMKETLHKASEP